MTMPSVPSDDHILDVIARAVLDDLAAEVQDRAVRQDDFEAADEIARDAVFDGAHAAGVRADVAADRRGFLARIRRVEEAALFDIGRDFHEQHARLDRQREVLFIEFEDVVHERHVDHEAVLDGDGCTDEARAGAARRHDDVVLLGIRHKLRDFFGRRDADDDVRVAALATELVVAVLLVDVVLVEHALFRDDREDCLVVVLIDFLVCAHAFSPFPSRISDRSFGMTS